MSDDLFSLLDDVPPPAPAREPPKPAAKPKPKKTVAPTKAAPQVVEADPDLEELAPNEMPDIAVVMRPIRITALAVIFGTEPRRIEKKLAKCPVLAWEMHKGRRVPVYDFKQACAYLVEPKIDMETWIKSQSSLSLPPMINKAFWEAMRTKMRVMAEAGDLWHTEDVYAVLGEIVKMIRTTTQLWFEDLPSKVTLSTEDHQMLQQARNDLIKAIADTVQEVASRRETQPYAATITSEIEQHVPTDDE